MNSPALIVGLQAEARIARLTGWPVFVGGGGAAGAENAAKTAVATGVAALVSFGLAGGLAPGLIPGTVIVAARVLADDQVFETTEALSAYWGVARAGTVLGHNRVVARAVDKEALWRATGAMAVDLESAAVARVAVARGLAHAVLRVVCDPAERDLPPAALIALDGGGAIGLARVLASVARTPKQIPAIFRLAGDAAVARRALRDAARRIGGNWSE